MRPLLRDFGSERVSHSLFILAIWLGPDPSCHALLERLRTTGRGELQPQCVVRLVG